MSLDVLNFDLIWNINIARIYQLTLLFNDLSDNFRILPKKNGALRFNDACLFSCNLGEIITKDILMIHGYTGNNASNRIHNVRGIQSATQPSFNDGIVN